MNLFCRKSIPSTVAAVVLWSPNHFPGHRLEWCTLLEQLSMTLQVNCYKISLVGAWRSFCRFICQLPAWRTCVSLNVLVEKGVADVAPPNFDQVRSQGLLSSRSKEAGKKESLETRLRLNYIVWRAGSELNMTENTTDSFPKPLKYSYVSCMVFSWLLPCGQSRDPSIIFILFVGEQWVEEQVEIGQEFVRAPYIVAPATVNLWPFFTRRFFSETGCFFFLFILDF